MFWTSLPPMTDGWRVYFYSSILFLTYATNWRYTPMSLYHVAATSNARFYEYFGATRFFGRLAYNVPFITAVHWITLVAWVCCIVGLGGRAAPIVQTTGYVFLHGARHGYHSIYAHRWHIPMFTMMALCLSDMNGPLSVDGWLGWASETARRAPERPASVFASGFARQFSAVVAIYTLVAGGYSKLRLCGLKWMDGASLRYYIKANPKGWAPAVKRLLVGSPLLAFALSVATIALECGAFVALTHPWTAPFVLLSAAGFHVGIWLTMKPNYWPQTLTYALALHWPWEQAPMAEFGWADFDTFSVCVFIFAWATVALLAVVALASIEWWPLTCVGMYSGYRGPWGAWSETGFKDRAQAREWAGIFDQTGIDIPFGSSGKWIYVRARAGADAPTPIATPPGVDDCQFSRYLQRQAVRVLCLGDAGVDSARAFLAKHYDDLVACLPDGRALQQPALELCARLREADDFVLAEYGGPSRAS